MFLPHQLHVTFPVAKNFSFHIFESLLLKLHFVPRYFVCFSYHTCQPSSFARSLPPLPLFIPFFPREPPDKTLPWSIHKACLHRLALGGCLRKEGGKEVNEWGRVGGGGTNGGRCWVKGWVRRDTWVGEVKDWSKRKCGLVKVVKVWIRRVYGWLGSGMNEERS